METKLKGKKILFVCTTDNMITQFLVPHIKDLLSFGAEVYCVCTKTGDCFEEIKSLDINVVNLKMKRSPINFTNLNAYFSLKKMQKQHKFDYIFCQQPTAGMLGRLIGKKFKIPVIYTAHGFFFFKGNNIVKNFVFRSAEKYLSNYTTAILTMNQQDFDATKNWKHPTKFLIHGIGLDTKKLSAESFEKTDFKKSLGLNDEDIVVTSVSEFIKRKNHKTMFKAMKIILEQNSNVKYLVCGTGKLLNRMKKYAKKLGIENKIMFLGYRNDVAKILQISDIFFHQSFHEGLTVSIMEAMYFGIPVVASAVRGNSDLVENGTNGITTKPKDAKSQAKAIQYLIDNPIERTMLGQQAQQKVPPFYLDNVRNELKQIYKDLGII